MCWSDKNLSGSKPDIFAATASCEICKTRAAGNLSRLIQWVTAAGVIPNASDNFLFPPRTEITSKIFTALPLTKSLNSCFNVITKCKEFCSLCTKKFTIDNSKISELVITRSGLPQWKKMISMPKYLLRMGKTPCELRRWENANHNGYSPRTILPVRSENLNTLNRVLRQYGLAKNIRCDAMGDTSYRFGWLMSGGKGSLIRRMISSMMQISTYALAGGMYVSASSWQDAPTAPPLNTQPLNGLRRDALNSSIGSLYMATIHIGSLADNIIRIKGENYVEQTSTERIKISQGNETV